MSTHRPLDPKTELYREVYDPITRDWFVALGRAQSRLDDILAEAGKDGVLTTLERMNVLFHELVIEVLPDRRDPAQDRILDVVRRLSKSVLWVEHSPPRINAKTDNVLNALRHKIQRNVSLGTVEALICLESARQYGRVKLELRGEALAALLERSRQLYTSLAVLHDEQEKERLHFLAGVQGHLAYPDTDYHHVTSGLVRIGFDKFVEVDSPAGLRLRWVSEPVPPSTPDSPVLRCPAQRLREGGSGRPLNDTLWDLLIDVYRRAGELD